jgi:hypothetical protein
VSDTPLVPGPLYGLRSWKVVANAGRELLAGPHRDTPWPAAGEWLVSSCARTPGHTAPGAGCECGIHAWHPRRAFAGRVLASRREVSGIVEAGGAVELHEDGFRAERARPHAFLLPPGRNPKLIRRLAATYRAEVVAVQGADAVLAWCRERQLGLSESVVADLLGPARLEDQRRARRRKVRADTLRIAAAVLAAAVLCWLGLTVLADPPGERVLHGRTGEIHVK